MTGSNEDRQVTNFYQKLHCRNQLLDMSTAPRNVYKPFQSLNAQSVYLLLGDNYPPPPKKKSCPWYDTKIHLMVRLWIWGSSSLPSLLPHHH